MCEQVYKLYNLLILKALQASKQEKINHIPIVGTRKLTQRFFWQFFLPCIEREREGEKSGKEVPWMMGKLQTD